MPSATVRPVTTVMPGPLNDLPYWRIGILDAQKVVHGTGLVLENGSSIRRIRTQFGDAAFSRGRITLWVQPALEPPATGQVFAFIIADSETIKATGHPAMSRPLLEESQQLATFKSDRAPSGGRIDLALDTSGVASVVLSRPPLVTVRASVQTKSSESSFPLEVEVEWDFTGLDPKRFVVIRVNSASSIEAVPEEEGFGLAHP
jgi:hypothetical protein